MKRIEPFPRWTSLKIVLHHPAQAFSVRMYDSKIHELSFKTLKRHECTFYGILRYSTQHRIWSCSSVLASRAPTVCKFVKKYKTWS